MSEITIQTVSIFTSVLFLVTLKLSDIARNMELQTVACSEHPPLFLLLPPLNLVAQDSNFRKIVPLPTLGRFNFLHGVNFLVLIAGFAWFIHVYPAWSWLKAIGISATGCGLLLLPIFEVDEYDSILKSGQYPKSLYYHIFGSLLFLCSIIVVYPVMRFLSDFGIPVYHYRFDFYVFTMAYLLTYLKFLVRLQNELKISAYRESRLSSSMLT